MRFTRAGLLALGAFAAATFIAARVGTPAGADPQTFHCAFDAMCPDVTVAGDPYATIGGNPAPFRGYGDPSIEYDAATGVVWLTYSWLDVLINDPGPPPNIDFGVRTHLARSDDGGQTFTYVRALNQTESIQHPDTSEDGWTIHEVSTIVKRGSGWEALWFTYFDPEGPAPPERKDFYYGRSLATTAGMLGDVSEAWITADATSPSFGGVHNFNDVPQLADCTVFTEPALLQHAGETYLTTACVVFIAGVRHPEFERTVLLRENAGAYEYLGVLLDYDDAVANGGERIEQVDLAIAENGAVLLIGTPIQDTVPEHLGCVVFEVNDLATAQVRRTTAGDAIALMRITGDAADDEVGPGLCTYDAESATGLLMVLHDFTPSPFDMEFSLRVTGIHPQGLDTDADGVADSADNCDARANPTQQLPPWPVTGDDADCDGFTLAAEVRLETDPAHACANTAAANDEADDRWPADFNDSQAINTLDLTGYASRLGTVPVTSLDQRHDLNGNGVINTLDLIPYATMLGKSCSP